MLEFFCQTQGLEKFLAFGFLWLRHEQNHQGKIFLEDLSNHSLAFSSLTTPPTPSSFLLSLWTNSHQRDPADSTHADNLILRPNELSTVTQFVTPDLTPTVTPSGSSTASQTAITTVVFTETDLHLDGDYESDVDSDNTSSLSISARVFSPGLKAPVFSTLVATENSLTPPQEREPLLSHDDPDTYLGGDSDEEPDDYSDDEDDYYSSCFGYDPSFDPGPCSPRPLSQGQPTEEGLCAWLEERGLGVGQPNHYLITKAQITLISEIDIDITPSYPYFTPLNS